MQPSLAAGRREFLKAAAIGTLTLPLWGASDKPNIVFILADDMGWGDATCNNPSSRISTPNIDRIAKEGVRFTNAHAPAAVCTPTRYGLLTGRYAWRTPMREGVLYPFCPALIRKGRMTLASLLKQQGYATAVFGKWHLGLDWTPAAGDPGDWEFGTPVRRTSKRLNMRVDVSKPVRNGPLDLGFDTFYGISDNAGDPAGRWGSRFLIQDDRAAPGTSLQEGVWSTAGFRRDELDDIFAGRAARFIEKNASRPFFVYLPLTAPHSPIQPPKRLQGKSGDGPRGDMCLWADQNVGRVLDTLNRLKLAGNTLLAFASDNGSVFNGDIKTWTVRTGHRPSGSYRGYKTDIWEGGTHIPFVARWPGRIPAASTSDRLLCLADMLATFASLLGVKLPEHAGEDSFNQLPALLGQSQAEVRDSLITHSYTGVFAIRQGPWKAIFDTEGSGGHRNTTPGWMPVIRGIPEEPGTGGVGQLYNLAEDPFEEKNLWKQRPEIVDRLRQLFQQHLENGRSRPG